MGKKRIAELLQQLEAHRQEAIEDTAAVFTVAQVAVNELGKLTGVTPDRSKTSSETAQEQTEDRTLISTSPVAALLPAPIVVTKAELQQRYGSFNACRNAAKQRGIKFSKTPSWDTLVAAFSYLETLKQLFNGYLDQYPNPKLTGTTLEFPIGQPPDRPSAKSQKRR